MSNAVTMILDEEAKLEEELIFGKKLSGIQTLRLLAQFASVYETCSENKLHCYLMTGDNAPDNAQYIVMCEDKSLKIAITARCDEDRDLWELSVTRELHDIVALNTSLSTLWN